MSELKFNFKTEDGKQNLLENLDRARLNLDSMGSIVECSSVTQKEIIKELEQAHSLILQIEDYKLKLYDALFFFI